MKNKLLLIGCLIFLSLFYAQASLTAEQIPDKNPEINIEDSDLLSNLSKLEKDSWEATKKHDTDFFRTYMASEFKGFFADGTSADRADFIRNLDDFQLTNYTMGKVSMLRINNEAVMILYKLGYEGHHKGKKIKMSGIESSSLYVLREKKWVEIFYQETHAASVKRK